MRHISLIALACVLPLAPALAQKAKTAPVEAVSAPKVQTFEVDNENIFGFTEGTDTNEQGEKEITLGVAARLMKRGLSDPALPTPQTPQRGGRYAAISPSLSFQYGVSDDFGVEITGFGARHAIRHVPEMETINRAGFDGLEVNVKYRLLERTRDNPYGFALVAGPRWARFSEGSGLRQRAFGNELRALFDVRLLDNRLWYAANVSFEMEGGREKTSRDFERESKLTLSQALSARVAGDSFAGVEMRYLRAYEGLLAKRFSGDALYLGPTFYQKLGKKAFFSAAWGIAVAGKSHDPANAPGQKLNLTQFSRHIVQAKAGFEF
jgi:hypothetical protein